MDVNASLSSIGQLILADDFFCTTTGPLNQLKVWGSWFHDEFPYLNEIPDAGEVAFTISLHDDVPGTDPVDFPIPCPWLPSGTGVIVITDGLPAGTTIEVRPKFHTPSCDASRCGHSPDVGKCEEPNGTSGDTHYCDTEIVELSLTGTGALSAFSRTLSGNGEFEVELAPRDPSASTRSFDTEIVAMSLSISGDPDFDQLEIRAGSAHGLPSPGHTILTRLGPPGSDFQVDSFFDITYRISYVGMLGSPLEGYSGTDNGSIRMEQKDANEVDDCHVTPSSVNHSYPGELLCLFVFNPGTFSYSLYAGNLFEGWYDPAIEYYDPAGDTQCWEYVFDLTTVPPPNCFYQEGTEDNPVVYWIDISARPTMTNFWFGWKSSYIHWNDDAVWGIGSEPYPGPWNEMRYPSVPVPHPWAGESVDLAFELTGGGGDPEGACCYPNPDGTANALCIVTTQADCETNLLGTYMGDGTTCTAPQACCLADGTCVTIDPLCCELLGGAAQPAGATCTQPEACCLPGGSCAMLDPVCCTDLGGSPQGVGSACTAPEACCLPDGSCAMLDPLCCTDLGGTPKGVGSACTALEACCIQGADCQMLDPLCCEELGGMSGGTGTTCTTPEACCLPGPSCQNLDPLCCQILGGTPQGAGTNCANVDCNLEPEGACCFPDPAGIGGLLCVVTTQSTCETILLGTYMGDGTACTAPEACCFADGTCQDLDPLCCNELGGTPQGTGSNCGNTDCATVPYTPKHWYQPPDLTLTGIDVLATYPNFVLAEDFECTETAGIQEIHIWGSWFEDIYPNGDDPGDVTFHISIHADIPPGFYAPWSMPGALLADWYFSPGQFLHKEVKLEDEYEGWMNPPDQWIPNGDRNCWEYIFLFDETNWFVQEGSASNPIIYWVDVQATVPISPVTALFGWKTSSDHWNDDAVWAQGEDLPVQLPWVDLRYPSGHPFYPESIDLSLLISGPCDCVPGEVDGTPPINILDIVWTINYKYKKGPAPIPYPLCSGDANCDCLVNILDVVYVINYKYKGGPPPCTCGNFIANCGGPLR